MPSERREVVVIGAGPAGLVVAATLARGGHGVALVDRGGPVTGGPVVLDRSAVRVLDDLGWGDLVGSSSSTRHEALVITGESETIRLESEWDVVAVERRPLVEALRRRSVAAGVVWMTGLVATVPLWEGGRVAGIRVRAADGSERDVRARLVVDASGPGAALVSALGLLMPRRGRRRVRRIGTVTEASGHRVLVGRGGWRVEAPVAAAVLATEVVPEDDHGGLHERPVEGCSRLTASEILNRSVGVQTLSEAGDGWVAIGEAAGSGAPGSPGVVTGGILAAASAAWEARMALGSGAAVGSSSFGATVAMTRRSVQLGSLLDRALSRASVAGVLHWAVATGWRRRRLGDVLRGDWSVGARLGRGWFLWRFDRVSRAARR